MTQPQQAGLIWPVLAFAARMQRVLTYGDLAGFTGIDQRGLAAPLGLIHRYCERKPYPVLNSIVVKAEEGEGLGFPGSGFPKQMQPIEHLVERARVFAFDWTVKEKPGSEDFEKIQSATAIS